MPDKTPSLNELHEIDREILRLVARRWDLLGAIDVADSSLASSPPVGGSGVGASSVGEALAQAKPIIDEIAATRGVEPRQWEMLLRHVVSLCNLQSSPQPIAYLGPRHSYSHQAAIEYFGDAATLVPQPTIAAVFEAVVRRQAVRGIVPIENSTDGRVVDTLSMFVQQPVNICGEVRLPIHHCLLSRTPQAEIREIYSKPQALSQCRTWLATHMPDVQLKEHSSTAAAAQLASQQPGVAAIASEIAGRQYDLNVIAAKIEDNPNNVTRFAVLGDFQPPPSGYDKTALVLQIAHRPGALANVMNAFKNHALNLTWIESYPMPSAPNEYLFFIELEGHRNDDTVKSAIQSLTSETIRCELLGSYRRA